MDTLIRNLNWGYLIAFGIIPVAVSLAGVLYSDWRDGYWRRWRKGPGA